MSPLVLLVAALATYRLTLLVTADAITAPARERTWGWLAELTHCHWCASVWLAPAMVASALWWSNGWGWWLACGSLSVSAVTGVLGTFARP